jgi:hypothetical protein
LTPERGVFMSAVQSSTTAELLATIEEQKGQLALALSVLLALGFNLEDFIP